MTAVPTCPVCGFQAKLIRSLSKHLKSKHNYSEENIQKILGKYPAKCSECKTSIRGYQAKEEKRYCIKCGSKSPERIAKIKASKLAKYGSETYCNPDKCKNTKLIKYGTSGFNNNAKIKATKLERYGNENYRNEDKIKATNLIRYGCEHNWSSEIVREKGKQTNLERHGDRNYKNSDKIRQTCLDKYGVEFSWQIDSVKDKIRETKTELYGTPTYNNRLKSVETCMTKYGVENPRKFREILGKSVRTLLDNTYDKLGRFSDKVIPLFTKEEYIGAEYEIVYDWHCNVCDEDFKHWYYGRLPLCPTCNPGNSMPQHELQSWIKTFETTEILYNTRSIIKPLELDIYIPDKRVAIEFNGTYWHTMDKKGDRYHFHKTQRCRELGIRLIHIWEHEWNNARQRPILENIIKNALGVHAETIMARKCKIIIKESNEVQEFFDTNNIAGFRGAKFCICLEYQGEIVMAYAMGSAFFGKGKYQWEVIRGATKLGINVVGGASKIWKYFLDNYKPESCVYYVDANYFDGRSIEKLEGFEYIKDQRGFKNYWVESGEVKNREPNKYEEIKELMKQDKVRPIENSGTRVYAYNK